MIIQDTQEYFSTDTGHQPVLLRRLPKASVAWINLRLMRRDPGYQPGHSVESYTAAILAKCAFTVASEADRADEDLVEGVADRYGGIGIGYNGGSGRAAYLNGYHIKGIGCTPLVGRKTDKGHSSGGAYLEECVRETVMSEIVDAEFPYGAVGIMAIIDTGESVVWQTDHGPKRERKCLLVRQPFLRPAHFERANFFLSDYAKEGARDTLRVRRMYDVCRQRLGDAELKSYLRQFWGKWAEQLAYGFTHRLSHGANSTSNVALDGKLHDFGGMTSLPSLGSFSTMYRQPRVGEELMTITQSLAVHARSVVNYLDAEFSGERQMPRLYRMIEERFVATEMREFLRCASLSRMEVKALLSSVYFQALKDSFMKLRNHYQRERLSFIESVPNDVAEFDIYKIWDEMPPAHLSGFANAVKRALNAISGQQCDAGRDQRRRSSLLRTANRVELYRQTFKSSIYDALERNACSRSTVDTVKTFVQTAIVNSRRDSRVEEPSDELVGFAYGDSSLALFRSKQSGALFAIDENVAPTLDGNNRFPVDLKDTSNPFQGFSEFNGIIHLNQFEGM